MKASLFCSCFLVAKASSFRTIRIHRTSKVLPRAEKRLGFEVMIYHNRFRCITTMCAQNVPVYISLFVQEFEPYAIEGALRSAHEISVFVKLPLRRATNGWGEKGNVSGRWRDFPCSGPFPTFTGAGPHQMGNTRRKKNTVEGGEPSTTGRGPLQHGGGALSSDLHHTSSPQLAITTFSVGLPDLVPNF